MGWMIQHPASVEQGLCESAMVALGGEALTTPNQLRDIVLYLQNRVTLVAEGEKTIAFNPPTVEEMTHAGLEEATVARLTSVAWWQEMVDDIIETPDFAEPDATPAVVLDYAKDVIQEYIGKRFPLDS